MTKWETVEQELNKCVTLVSIGLKRWNTLPSFGYKQLSICLGSRLKIRFKELSHSFVKIFLNIQTERGACKYEPRT